MEPLFEVMDELQLLSFSMAQQNLQANHLYAVIEGAKVPDGYQSTGALLYTLESTPSAHPLLLDDELIKVSPWLVKVEPISPLFDWLINNANKHPFVLFWSSNTIEQVKPFMVKLLNAKSPQGGTLFFRYYNPAVFNVFIEHSPNTALINRLGGPSAIAAYSPHESDQNQSSWHVRELNPAEVDAHSANAIKPPDIVFNQQEWQALCDSKRDTSLKQMGIYLKKNYPDHLQDIESSQIQRFVSQCISQGESLGFFTRNELEQWLDLSLFFGENFVDSSRYLWAKKIVNNAELSTNRKLQQLNQYLDFYQARSAI